MSTLHVFDMDGTLYDTREANRIAYETAGLPEYKDEYFNQTAAAWGCPPEIHEAKTRIFHQYSHLINPAWAMPMFEVADRCKRAIVLTGASSGSFRTVEKIHGRPFDTPFGITLNEEAKRRALRNLVRCGWNVVYYDDNVEMGDRITRFTPVGGTIRLITPEDIV